MNSLFIYPPLCYPVSPYFSLPLLSSILNENGHNTECLDINALLWDEKILNKKYLSKRFEILKHNLSLIKSNKYSYSDKTEKEFLQKRLKATEVFIEEREKNLDTILDSIEEAKINLKSKTEFYNYEKFHKAIYALKAAQNLFLRSFFLSDMLKTEIGQHSDTLNYFVQNKNLNPFYDYFYEKIKNNEFDKYDVIFISQPFGIQTFGLFTLAYLLKKHTKTKVCIGGNYISRISDSIKNKKIFFDNYIDYCMVGIGEESIIKIADYIDGKEKIENIPGLIYKDNSDIKSSAPALALEDIRKRTKVEFKGIDFKNYLIPEVVIPIQVSKGCPWGKCSFCVFHEGKPFYQITPPKQIALEFKYYYDKYGITKFEFSDEALSPKYYYEFAKEIINLGIKISYYGFARFEKGFTPEIMETMKKSGFKIFEWGYETPNKRVMEIYNKGIDIDSRLDILKIADKVGIWNHCLTISEVPFETAKEELEDFDFYEKKQGLFHSRLIASFILYKNAPIAKNTKESNMTEITDDGDFSISSSFKRIDEKEYSKSAKEIEKRRLKLYKDYGKYIWVSLIAIADEYLFLYITKYGKDKCKNAMIQNVINNNTFK